MNDIRLLAIKNGRVMLPGVAVLLVLSGIRMLSDATALVQVHAIAVMIISVFLAVFALDTLLRCIALAEDRLMLLSPVSRWGLVVRSAATTGTYLVLAYVASSLPGWFADGSRTDLQLVGVLGYVCSVVCGLGFTAALTFALNGLTGVTKVRAMAWTVFAATTGLYAWMAVLVVQALCGHASWLVGVSGSKDLVNLYAISVPVSFLGAEGPVALGLWGCVASAVLAVVLWVAAWALSRRRQNYLGA